MDILQELIVWLSAHMRPWVAQIAVAILATLLVLYGPVINRKVRALLGGAHFVIRLLVFVLLCTFGYGLLLVWSAPLLARAIAGMGSLYLAPVVILAFVLLGYLAERKNQM